MAKQNKNSALLYTIRSWYENKTKTGIILILTAKDSAGEYHSIKAYVPYRSNYEDAPKAEKLLAINNLPSCARVTVYNEKIFEEEIL